ncbi:sodium-dependent transporter [Litorimonas sp. WD9-15]|uniref:sodium-dependent transporter n=1 Tax=Litorimonas sp. WD9-15 TaxID=3418716 RepID=UPI003D0322F8
MASTPIERGTAQWSSRFAFIMAAVGSSVGLGNLWRFSAELGTNGGAAFLMIYIACIVFVGVPVLMSEYIIGRAGNSSSAVGSNNDLAERSGVSKVWSSGAWFGMVASFLIVSFYCVVAAWVLSYIPKFLFGTFNGMPALEIEQEFGKVLANPNTNVLPYFLFFGLLTSWLVSRGVNRGIELAAKLLMPIFFILLIGLAAYSIISSAGNGGTSEAFAFMFTPDFSKINAEVAQSALGQACFSIGIGNAIMITYGAYLPRDVSIPKSAVTISFVDTLVAIIAGLAIFPVVFANNLDFEAGAGIFFTTLPTAMSNAPGGMFIGAAFFFLAFFAAITSSVSLLEPSVAYLAEKTAWTKRKAAWITGAAIMTLGLGSIYISGFMDFIDGGLAGPILAPLSALLIVLFTGWRLNKAILAQELDGPGRALGEFIMIFVKYIAPIFMGLILVMGIWGKWIAPLFAG